MLNVAAGFSERLLHDKCVIKATSIKRVKTLFHRNIAACMHFQLNAFFQTLCVLISNTTKGAFQKKPYQ